MTNKKTNESECLPTEGKSWLIGRQKDDESFENEEILNKVGNRTYTIVIIYDVVDDKRRYKLSKVLLGYGERVQRSAFECHLTNRQYEEMIKKAIFLIDEEEDLLRIYKLTGHATVQVWGKIPLTEDEDLIII